MLQAGVLEYGFEGVTLRIPNIKLSVLYLLLRRHGISFQYDNVAHPLRVRGKQIPLFFFPCPKVY